MAELLEDEVRQQVSQAFSAYNAMETTKRRHFDYLNLLESRRKKFNLETSLDESQLLASLLRDHDQAVKHFKAETQSLLQTTPAAHKALFEYIGRLNQVTDDTNETDGTSH